MRNRAWVVGFCAAALAGCDSVQDQITAPAAPVTRSSAQAQVLPLTGEGFLTTDFVVSGQCDENGNGAFQFTAKGLAEGPYPGTFTETGQFVVNQGIADFGASFTINSTTVIQGNKFGRFPVDLCDPSGAVLAGDIEYVASIDGFTDHGRTFVDVVAAAGGGNLNQFFQSLAQAVLVLDPAFAENPVGTSHTVTATVYYSTGQPAQGVPVDFQVSSPSGFSAAGGCVTGPDGRCSFTYQGPQQPDVHTIEACAHTVGVPACGVATKVFFVPASTPGSVTGGGHILHEGKIHGVSFGFVAKLNVHGFQGNGVIVDHRTKTKIKILDVDFLLITGTHATFAGNATINGVRTRYTIDVDDLGEPGRNGDTFKLVTTSGYAVGGPLTGGNIKIHR
jgi:hypothetical protein